MAYVVLNFFHGSTDHAYGRMTYVRDNVYRFIPNFREKISIASDGDHVKAIGFDCNELIAVGEILPGTELMVDTILMEDQSLTLPIFLLYTHE